jgi:hypothetical protein
MKMLLKAKIYTTVTVLSCFSFNNSYSQACTGSNSELVTNGGFELCTGTCDVTTEGTVLTTDYTNYSGYSASDCDGGGPGHAFNSGKYAIVSDASACYFGFWGGQSTPAGNSVHNGNYAMLIDGDGTILNAWCQSVPVTATKQYQFTAYLNNPWNTVESATNSDAQNIPNVRFTIGGVPVSTLVATPTVNGGWDQLNCVTTATTTGNVNICIEILLDATGGGNDLLIDDISFKEVATCPSGTCGYQGVTPVNLVSFEAKENGCDALLQWSATMETRLSGYVVEKSTDAIHFYELGEVKALSLNSSLIQNYQLKDNHFTEVAYYRLKIQDIDGKFYYSQIQNLVKNGDKVIISRVEDGIEVKALVNKETDWHMAFFSMVGQELVNKIISLEKGEHLLLNSKTHQGKGSEILRITTGSGEVVFSGVIVW